MPKESKSTRYKSVTLPEHLVEEIKPFIKSHPQLGYSGVAEFLKTAVREKFERHGHKITKGK